MKHTPIGDDLSNGFCVRASSESPPLYTFNYADFAGEFGDLNASDEEKEALLRTIWNGIIVPSVQMGWGIHPIDQALDQQSQNACGSFSENQDQSVSAAPGMVELDPEILAAAFGNAAQEQTKGGAP